MTAYTIFSQATNWTLVTDANAYTLGMQFSVSQPMALTGIWFHSATGATALPVQCVIFNGDTTAQVGSTLQTSPTWSGAAGSGWVKCTYDGTVTLAPGVHYVVAVLYNTTGHNWYSDLNGYWTSGAGAGGITNGPLSAPNSASALNGQTVFHAGTTLTFPATTQTGFDFGVDVEVSTTAPTQENPVPPPLIRPHPYALIRDEAQQRIDWASPGVADLTVAFASTSGGVDTYNVTSPYNGGSGGNTANTMRVLKPTAPNPSFPHAFLLMLPVENNQNTGTYGDPIGTAQALGAHNGYNLTCVQPGYAGIGGAADGPWYADNPLNQAIWQEKYTLLVTDWVRQHLATTGIEQVYLIGFSRSGLGGQNLLFRHPYLYAACAAWDAPFGMSNYDGTDPIRGSPVGGDPQDGFGTSANFTNNYQLTVPRLAGYQGTGQYGINRIWIGLGPSFQADVPWYDGQLTSAGIPHTYTFSDTAEAHAWQTDWVAAGLQAIIPSNEPTVLPQQIHQQMLVQLLEIAEYRTEGGPPPVAAVTAAAGLATGTAVAQGPVPAVAPAAGLASAAAIAQPPPPVVLPAAGLAAAGGTAQPPVPAVTPNAALASGTGTAQAPAPEIIPAAALAAGTGTAQPPVPVVIVSAGLAAGAGEALNPSVSTSGSTTANAGLASGTGTAPMVIASVTVTAGLATAAGTAQQPAAAVQVTAVLAAAAGSASQPAIAITVTAGLATGTSAALGPVPPGPPVAVVFRYGTPYFEWDYGTPCSGWATGDPYLS